MPIAPDGDTRDKNVPSGSAISITADDIGEMQDKIDALADSIASLQNAGDKALAEAKFEVEAARAIEQIVGMVVKLAQPNNEEIAVPKNSILSQLISSSNLTGILSTLRG